MYSPRRIKTELKKTYIPMKKILILTLLLCSRELAAQTTYAVLVGISDYKNFDADTGDLGSADKDARKMYAFFNPSKSKNVVMLLNGKATKSAIREAMYGTLLKAGPNDKIIFYFAGHGDVGSFIPYEIGDPASGPLNRTEVLDVFKRSKAGIKVLIADACHSGAMGEPKAVTGKAGEDRVLMMLSARKAESSIERAGGGLFTKVLLQGLAGHADQGKKDGKVTARELFVYTKRELNKLTRNEQSPVFKGKFPDGWVLSVY